MQGPGNWLIMGTLPATEQSWLADTTARFEDAQK
jgi:hypothetical protein